MGNNTKFIIISLENQETKRKEDNRLLPGKQ